MVEYSFAFSSASLVHGTHRLRLLSFIRPHFNHGFHNNYASRSSSVGVVYVVVAPEPELSMYKVICSAVEDVAVTVYVYSVRVELSSETATTPVQSIPEFVVLITNRPFDGHCHTVTNLWFHDGNKDYSLQLEEP